MSDFNADARAQLKALHPDLFPASADEQEITRLRVIIAERDAEIARLRMAASQAADDLTYTSALYEAGDQEIIATIVGSLRDTRDDLNEALAGKDQ